MSGDQKRRREDNANAGQQQASGNSNHADQPGSGHRSANRHETPSATTSRATPSAARSTTTSAAAAAATTENRGSSFEATSGHTGDVLRTISLPTTIDLESFVSARKDELANLTEAVKTRMRKLVSQQLPHHLRRRAVSHNKKRLPKRMQERFNSSGAKETKRPSRLHRRRPRNLQEEYSRRARKHRWLETHLWHAKRFRMAEKFGYKIPESSFDKSLRACYRGASKYCLLNDISFECCVELRGDRSAICNAMARISSPKTGLTVGAKKFIGGRAQGSLWLYEVDAYPYRCLGEVSFIWRPPQETTAEQTLWLWCHPELRETLIAILMSLLDLVEVIKDADNDRPPMYKGPQVTLLDLRDELNRFRLTGPLSVRVLCETLTQDESGLHLAPPLSLQPSYFNAFWKSLAKHALSAFSYTTDGMIAGNVVLDPRLHMPTKRMVSSVIGAEPDAHQDAVSALSDEVPLLSDIWDEALRASVKKSMMTQDQINKLRHENLVPGTPLELGERESRIPILVVFRNGCLDKLGYSRGCDIILPSGWGRQFFIALNYRSARAAGLRDLKAVTRYSGRFVFPDDVLDSHLATPHLEKETDDLLTKHLRYPPNKRPAFAKLGISLPYSLPFRQLIQSFTETPITAEDSVPEDFFVLRDRVLLKKLAEAYAKTGGSSLTDIVNNSLPEKEIQQALLPVKVTCLQGGVPTRFARLYGLSMDSGHMQEPIHMTTIMERTVKKEDLAQGVLDAAMDNLYHIIGFLVYGDRNFTEKAATGLGYVSLKALVKVTTQDKDGLVAFRNQHCFNYHLVQMHVLC